MATGSHVVTSPTSSLKLGERLRALIEYRGLLLNLIRRELRARYKESVLSFAWSMLNPLLYLVVFYVVFNLILPAAIPLFAVFLLSGLLPWTLFTGALGGGAGSVVGNGPLLKKVYFPREVFPLAAIGSALFHFGLQMIVLIAFLVIFRYPFVSEYLVLVPLALLVEVLLLIGLTLLLSSVTVYLRDVQHFLDLALLAWFWMTPIIYPVALVASRLEPRGLLGLYLLNPMTPIVLSFQRAFYNKVSPTVNGEQVQILLDQPMSWYVQNLALVGLAALVLIVIGQVVFAKLEGNFASEL